MRCSKAHKWIALYRDGELDAGKRQQLLEHLATCEPCSELSRVYRQNDRLAELIRGQSHAPDAADNLTSRIMKAVTGLEKHTGKAISVPLTDQVLDFFILPLTRRIALACIVIIALSFGYQQYTVYSSITELEKQLSAAGKTYLAEVRHKDMDDCMRRSARYLRRLQTDQKETEHSLRKYFSDNPDKMNLYATLWCSHQYKSLKKHAGQDFIFIQGVIAGLESETE